MARSTVMGRYAEPSPLVQLPVLGWSILSQFT